MSHYRELYERVFAAVRAAVDGAGARDGSPGFRSVRRGRPTLEPAPDMTLPACVVAPREGWRERVRRLLFSGWAVLDYPVWVGFAVDDRGPHDVDGSDRLADARQAAIDALWVPGRLADLGEYDVTLDPDGEGGEPPPPNVLGSWARFDFTVTRRRDG